MHILHGSVVLIAEWPEDDCYSHFALLSGRSVQSMNHPTRAGYAPRSKGQRIKQASVFYQSIFIQFEKSLRYFVGRARVN